MKTEEERIRSEHKKAVEKYDQAFNDAALCKKEVHQTINRVL